MYKRHSKKKKGIRWTLCILPGIVLITVIIVFSLKLSVKLRYDHDDIDLTSEIDGEHVPLFLQSDIQWGNDYYGDDVLSVTGCGPTCLSMVYCYITGDMTMHPGKMAAWAAKEGFYAEGIGTSWDLMDLGAKKLGLDPYTMPLSEDNIVEALSSGHVIICSVGPGDFTTEGHFIVLAGINENGSIRVNDPNSKQRSKKEWEIDRIVTQIKQFWIY